MGSYNTQCFATKQTIAPEDPVFLFPVVPSIGYSPAEFEGEEKSTPRSAFASSRSICYPDRYWTPLGVCIQGQYQDYGRFVPDSNQFNLRQLLLLYEHLLGCSLVTQEGENSSHEKAFDLKAHALTQGDLAQEGATKLRFVLQASATEGLLDAHAEKQLLAFWEYFQEALSKGRLFVLGPEKNAPARSVHLAVASAVAVRNSSQVLVGELAPYSQAVGYDVFIEHNLTLVQHLKTWMRQQIEASATGTACEPVVQLLRGCYPIARWNDGLFDLYEGYIQKGVDPVSVAEWIYSAILDQRDAGFGKLFLVSDSGSELHYLQTEFRAKVAKEICDAQSQLSEEFETWFESVIQIDLFLKSLTNLYLAIEPMAYVTQDYDNSIGIRYAQWVAAVGREIEVSQMTDEGDED